MKPSSKGTSPVATSPLPPQLIPCCPTCVLSLHQIVYVAPMKALAAEVTANFGKRLAALGLVVRELTGVCEKGGG
jgi:hypothetical protein